MEQEKIRKIYEILNNLSKTSDNQDMIEEIKNDLLNEDYIEALKKIEKLDKIKKKIEVVEKKKIKEEDKTTSIYPKKLSNIELEHVYMGLLLNEPQLIAKYYFLFEDCYFEDDEILNVYKSVLFTEGATYTPEIAKNGFSFSKDSEKVYKFKRELKARVEDQNYNIEKIYVDLRKLFVLRKNYLAMPIKNMQDKVVEIMDYILYDKMSIEEVENAVVQVNDTEKFKRAILNENLTSFLEMGDNNLRNGLNLPFPILTNVFKGIRKGETMAFAMPSNAGKSRFTIDLAAHVALIHKKKVLIISNEMSEEKMKLCLITTILNNSEIQKIHGQEISKTEGELLEFKFRPDDPKKVEVDEKGFIVRKKDEKQGDFVKRLMKESTEFKKTVAITDWANREIKNSIYKTIGRKDDDFEQTIKLEIIKTLSKNRKI